MENKSKIKYSTKLDFNTIEPNTKAALLTIMDYMRSLGLRKTNSDLEKDSKFFNQY
jgi:hypothetical protein